MADASTEKSKNDAHSTKKDEEVNKVSSQTKITSLSSSTKTAPEIVSDDEMASSPISKSIKSLSLNESETSIDVPFNYLPSCNIPEKIIIIFDQATDDEDSESFELSNGNKFTVAYMLTRALKLFLHNKLSINPRHQFALMFLNQFSSNWECDFTSNPQEIISRVQQAGMCKSEDLFNFNPVFETIFNRVQVSLAHFKEDEFAPPPTYMVHVVLLYGRSYTRPILEKTDEMLEYFNSPYFTVDVVMTHNPPGAANRCNEIFKLLQQFDPKGSGYAFSVSRNAAQLHEAMAKVLSHPLQRPPQSLAKYDIKRFKDM